MNITEFLLSVSGGAISTLVTLVSSHYSESFFHPVTANALGLVIGGTCNFLLQKFSFNFHQPSNSSLMYRYIIAEIAILSISQVLFKIYHRNLVFYQHQVLQPILSYLPKKFQNKKYYNSAARLIIAVVVFTVVSFPLRKFWVFKKA